MSIPVKPDSVNYTITGTKATYTIKEGETLTRVSLRFYGTKDLWPYIVKHNRGVIKNPNNVPYGTVLKIPELVKNDSLMLDHPGVYKFIHSGVVFMLYKYKSV